MSDVRDRHLENLSILFNAHAKSMPVYKDYASTISALQESMHTQDLETLNDALSQNMTLYPPHLLKIEDNSLRSIFHKSLLIMEGHLRIHAALELGKNPPNGQQMQEDAKTIRRIRFDVLRKLNGQ